MEEKVVDRRVRKTKRQLRLALMKLMSEKSVKDISVRELAAIADINRTCIQPDKQSALRCQQAEHQQNGYNNVCEVFAGCLHGFCPSVS